ncbi:FliI/YscN family ATPase [Lentilitoribacter sp. EG35]|uniref:FliI/YscN family ATPase n=1 Tax=Lentilitoribacter sp. EG35 TaxID=3234192 RepID=UPI003460D3E9
MSIRPTLPEIDNALRAFDASNLLRVGGRVTAVSQGSYSVAGLSRDLGLGDFVDLERSGKLYPGEVVHVGPEEVVICPLKTDNPAHIGDKVFRKGGFEIQPDLAWCGRTINSLAEPIDGLGPLKMGSEKVPLSSAAPPSMQRNRVNTPIRTGVKVVDIFTPICQGQRLGIFAGSGVGKSTMLSMFAKTADFDRAVIALVGERGREVREFIEETMGDNLAKSVVVVATSDESPSLRKMAPLTAMATAEYFRDRGENVLLIIDSLTRYAHALREIGVASGEPPVARGYPASVFTAMPQLLERAGPGGKDAGAITAIVSILIDGDNHNDPIADNARGILDGHLVLDRSLADAGRYPPVDPMASISRLARKVWSSDEEVLANRIKALIHKYEETQDLRLIGGYRPGTDPDLDMAVVQVPIVYENLKQTPSDPSCQDAFGELASAMKAAAFANEPAEGSPAIGQGTGMR